MYIPVSVALFYDFIEVNNMPLTPRLIYYVVWLFILVAFNAVLIEGKTTGEVKCIQYLNC